MNLFRDWQCPKVHGIELLEAHEDWLIHILDTLGNSLDHYNHPHLVTECLDRVQRGLHQFIHHEVQLLGCSLNSEQHMVQHGMLASLQELSYRHERGEHVGPQLLERLHHWLTSHCNTLHHQTLQ